MELDFLALAIEGPLPEPKQSPKRGLYPNYITKKGKKLWDNVLVEFADTISSQSTKGRQWAAAILFYKQEALKAKIPPFGAKGADVNVRNTMLNSLRRQANTGLKKANKHLSGIFRRLERRGMLDAPVSDVKLAEVGKQGGRYFVMSKRTAKLPGTIKPEWILDELKKNWKYEISKGAAYNQIDGVTDILFEMSKRKVDVYVTTFFTKAQIMVILELEKASEDQILKKLKKAGKNWLSNRQKLEAQVGGVVLASWIGNELLPTMDEAKEDKVNLKDRNRLLDWLKLKKYTEVLRYIMRLNDREYKRLMDLVYQ